MKVRPSRLEPIFDTRPWGVHSLAPLFPEQSDFKEKIGEAWLTGEKCRFADGPFAGLTLGEAWPRMPVEWTGTKVRHEGAFPILVKFIFTDDKLSVQVHPDDDYASQHEKQAGGRGKTEMWYFVSARPRSEILFGLKFGVERDSFRRAIDDATVENLVVQVPTDARDAIFVPAGTVHAIGAGFVLCEIQEQSDITYRVYDYNRRNATGETRALHVDKAMDVIRFGEQRGGKIQPVTIERGPISETYLAACRYFATERWEFSESISRKTSLEHFDLLISIAGSGAIEANGEKFAYAPAQVWLIPAALGTYQIVPQERTEILRTYVPASLDQYARHLRERGVNESQLAHLVHK
ncbi:MAG TPA: class I mannose-6-phosphate isomerase [Candidatus Acidoferrales bacterium]